MEKLNKLVTYPLTVHGLKYYRTRYWSPSGPRSWTCWGLDWRSPTLCNPVGRNLNRRKWGKTLKWVSKALQTLLIISKASSNITKNISPHYNETQEIKSGKQKPNQENGQLRPMRLKDTKDKQGGIQGSRAEKETTWGKRQYGQTTEECMAVKISNWPLSLVSTLITTWQSAARQKLRTMRRELLRDQTWPLKITSCMRRCSHYFLSCEIILLTCQAIIFLAQASQTFLFQIVSKVRRWPEDHNSYFLKWWVYETKGMCPLLLSTLSAKYTLLKGTDIQKNHCAGSGGIFYDPGNQVMWTGSVSE